MKKLFWTFSMIVLVALLFGAKEQGFCATTSSSEKESQTQSSWHAVSLVGLIQPVVLYVPNRIFDILDIVRLRLRIGPGLSAGARVTELVDIFMGSHATGYIGLRGARGKPQIPWPLGLEKNEGIEISIADVTDDGKHAPYVDPLEISVQAQPVIAGVYVGLEVFEILDLAAGLLFLDLQGDDF